MKIVNLTGFLFIPYSQVTCIAKTRLSLPGCLENFGTIWGIPTTTLSLLTATACTPTQPPSVTRNQCPMTLSPSHSVSLKLKRDSCHCRTPAHTHTQFLTFTLRKTLQVWLRLEYYWMPVNLNGPTGMIGGRRWTLSVCRWVWQWRVGESRSVWSPECEYGLSVSMTVSHLVNPHQPR